MGLQRAKVLTTFVVVALVCSWFGPPRAAAAVHACSDFASQAAAQTFFLSHGGPALDPSGLDPDDDGLACEAGAAPFKGLVQIDLRTGEFTGAITSVEPDCVVGRAVTIFKVSTPKDKRLGTATTEDDGKYTLPTTLTKGKFYAKASKTASCAGERSAIIKAPLGRFEIAPGGVFFTGASQTRQLSVKAFDARDAPLPAPTAAFWSSSDPSVIDIDRSGIATSLVGNGSAQITATVNGVVSAPVLAVVTPLPAGATLLTDAQIVGDPVETTPDADPSFDNTFFVTLTGVSPPAVDDLLINMGDKPVIGRVVSVEDLGGGQLKVTLRQVGLDEAFPDLEVDQALDLTHAPVDFDPGLTDGYDVVRIGTTYKFTPKTGSSAPRRTASSSADPQLPPFTKCKVDFTGGGSGLPIQLKAPPIFSVSVNPTLDFVRHADNSLEHLVVKATPTVSFEGGISLTAAFEGKIKCTRRLFIIRASVLPPPLSFILSGLIPIGIGFEIGGKLTVATAGISTKVSDKGVVEGGIACTEAGDCDLVHRLDLEAPKLTPTIDLPDPGDVRFEPSLSAFATVEAAVGNPLLTSLRLDLVEGKAGAKVSGSFATKRSQISATDYKSSYKISLDASMGLGTKLSDVAKALGVSSISGVEAKVSTDLATSPTGSLLSDKSSFVTGDEIQFAGHLDSTEFLGLYNVDRVLLVRDSGGSLTEVASKAASPGQTDFAFTFKAPGPGSTDEFFLFALTKALPFDIFALEIAKAVPRQVFASTSNPFQIRADACASSCVSKQVDTHYSDAISKAVSASFGGVGRASGAATSTKQAGSLTKFTINAFASGAAGGGTAASGNGDVGFSFNVVAAQTVTFTGSVKTSINAPNTFGCAVATFSYSDGARSFDVTVSDPVCNAGGSGGTHVILTSIAVPAGATPSAHCNIRAGAGLVPDGPPSTDAACDVTVSFAPA